MNKHRTGKVIIWCSLVLLLLLASSTFALAAEIPTVRVLLESVAASQLSVTLSNGEYTAVNENGETLAALSSGDVAEIAYAGGKYQLSVNGESVATDQPVITLAALSDAGLFAYGGKQYRGDFKAMSSGVYFYAINVLDVERYLYGVVGKEMGYGFPEEALKAQAIASRSFALAKVKPGNIYYDLTNNTSSQTYGGYDAEAPGIIQAVDVTRGVVVYYQGKAVDTAYHSNAGGYTEDSANIWGSGGVPIKGVESPYDSYAAKYSSYSASSYAWTVEYTAQKMTELANAYGNTDIGDFVEISALTSYNGATSVSGRALSVTITGTKGSVTAIRDSNIRRLLSLKSSLFSIAGTGSASGSGDTVAWMKDSSGKLTAATVGSRLFGLRSGGTATQVNGENSSFYVISSSGTSQINKSGAAVIGSGTVVINGKGYGHGVGLSQWGAIGMADSGYSAKTIIEHYYCGDGNSSISVYQLY